MRKVPEPAMVVRQAQTADASAIAELFNHFITETTVTFEEAPVSAAQIVGRLEDTRAAGLPWLIAERQGRLLGYAYAGRWRRRRAYRFAVETTAYVAPAEARRGVASALYRRLLADLEAQGMHSVIAVIALPNDASVGFHQRLGFRQVGLLKAVGFKLDHWIDVGYWQRLL